MNDLKINGSGCKDLTAYAAVKSATKTQSELEKRMNDLIKVLKLVIAFTGFELVDRIAIKDKESGRVFR